MRDFSQPTLSKKQVPLSYMVAAFKANVQYVEDPGEYIHDICSYYERQVPYNAGLAPDAVAISKFILSFAAKQPDEAVRKTYGDAAYGVLNEVAYAMPEAISFKLRENMIKAVYLSANLLGEAQVSFEAAQNVILRLAYGEPSFKKKMLDSTTAFAKDRLALAAQTSRCYEQPMIVSEHLCAVRQTTRAVGLLAGLLGPRGRHFKAAELVAAAHALTSRPDFREKDLTKRFQVQVARDPSFAAIYNTPFFHKIYEATPQARADLWAKSKDVLRGLNR